MSNSIKFLLSILLLSCLLNMPYGYYQLVRFIALVGFAYLAYQAKEKEAQTEFIIFCVLALLFQPFFKIALGRELWNIVDVVVSMYLLSTIFMRNNESPRKLKKEIIEKKNY